MVAIVQSNPYQVLSRKIGYSVGLEYLVRNVKTLVDFYAKDGRLSLSDWREIVERDFGREQKKSSKTTPPYVHIANFFSELNLIKIIANEVHPLHGLDTLSIIRRYIKADEKYDRALRVVLSQFLIEADGDIFLNALGASFSREGTRTRLCLMVEAKWGPLRKVFVNRNLQQKIWDIVSIRSQPANAIVERDSPSGASPFAKRTQPLSSFTRRPDSAAEAFHVEVQDSYLDKILPTRKGWATDLGYFDGKSLTTSGEALLSTLGKLGMLTETGAIAFWPYAHDLATLRIDHHQLSAEPISNWDCLCGIAAAAGATTSDLVPTEDDLLALMRTVFDLYRSGNAGRGSIRHQVPIYIMKPAVVGIYAGEKKPIPPLPQFIQAEITGSTRRFDFTNIRGTEGALIFRDKTK